MKTESPIVEKRTLEPREVSELLSEWVPFLSKGFCKSCSGLLQSRLHTLATLASGNRDELHGTAISNGSPEHSFGLCSAESVSVGSAQMNSPSLTSEYREKSVGTSSQTPTPKIPKGWGQFRDLSFSVDHHGSSSEFLIKRGHVQSFTSATSNQFSAGHSVSKLPLEDEFREPQLDNGASSGSTAGLSRDDREQIRLSQVKRKKDFVHMERISGKPINILKGLELHTGVFNPVEQEKIVDYVFKVQRMGQQGKLRARTYSEPRKWMRGKGRVTIQFGCCYNYATDKNGNPPGILREEEVDPLPPLFKTIIKRLVQWHVLPPTCVPNSCIVNIYDEGDCIPPHIDHHDFLRPFCTISFLTKCNILFGENLKIVGPGEFSGPVSIPLPVGSVLILSGNGADIAKHSVPAVPGRRISITFRKMDESKLPYSFKPDPELEGLQPLLNTSKRLHSHHVQAPLVHQSNGHSKDVASKAVSETTGSSYQFGTDDFPPLGGGGSTSANRSRSKTSWSNSTACNFNARKFLFNFRTSQSQIQAGNNSSSSIGMLNDVGSNDSSPFDMNDFPQLTGHPSSARGPQGQLGSLWKQGVGVSSIVQ